MISSTKPYATCLWSCLFYVTLALVCAPAEAQLEPVLTPGEIVDEVAPPPPEWKGNFSAGLNGKSGNSENVDINMTLNLNRETDWATTDILANYFYSTNQLGTTTDRGFGQFRQERKFDDPRWSWFNQIQLEVDRFRDFDYRIALHTGLAYKVIDEENHKFKLRFGAGASREVGSTNTDWSPELQFGSDWERQLSDTTKIYASVDFFPNVSDFSDYRLNTNTGVDFKLDQERDITFRIFALNRYDSTPPAGNLTNDIDYGMAIGIGF